MQPRQKVAPDVAWHVTGSVLGIDIALTPLVLRRLNFDRVVDAPRLTSNQREAFATSVVFMNPYTLRDEDRDAIVDAIDRSRRRVAALTSAADLDTIGGELGFESARQRAMGWTFAHQQNRVESLLSLTELLILNGGPIERLSP